MLSLSRTKSDHTIEEEIKKSDRNEKEPVPPRHTDAASSAFRPLYLLRAAAHHLRRRRHSLAPPTHPTSVSAARQEVRHSTTMPLPPPPVHGAHTAPVRPLGCICVR
ncbi:hypothetical protein B0H19DRAFT_1265741 [Mycena capillaripes]|nr:hypothetical protein B0H19DRAFT_1265741 [Mycena capillaripes]